MARISDNDIQKVREATDIVALFADRVPMKQKGRDFWCCCPFHNEKTPSLKVDPTTQLWHCFGCGEGGDAFGFLMKSEDLSFPEAVRTLADRAGITIAIEEGGVPASRKSRLKEVCSATAAFYSTQLMRGRGSGPDEARKYLASRGFGSTVCKAWGLGFAPGSRALVKHLESLGFKADEMVEANVAVQRPGRPLNDCFFNRIMFPISDATGQVIAFGGRIIGSGDPKYLNSQETPLFHKSAVLYGLDKAKASMTTTGDAIVVEGYTDVIALHEAGITNVVATLGTALTMQHIRLLSRHASKRIIYLFDGDGAGQRAADRALGFINSDMTPEAGKTRTELCAVTLPNDLDPADYVAKEGADALRALLNSAQPLVKYGIERRISAHNTETAEGRTRAFTDALSVLAPIKDSLLAKDYAIEIAGRLSIREEDALSALDALKPPAAYGESARQETSAGADNSGSFTASGGPNAAPAKSVAASQFSASEKSRLRTERRLLGLLAQNPPLALANTSALAGISWHDSQNAAIAEALLQALEANPQISAASFVAAASEKVPAAAGSLTSARVSEEELLEPTVTYLAEELEIGDMENTLASMTAQLKDQSLDAAARDLLFRATVDIQNTLNAKRATHKPALSI